ncbi:hypothetical protein [Salipiger sp.]
MHKIALLLLALSQPAWAGPADVSFPSLDWPAPKPPVTRPVAPPVPG